MPGRPKRTGPPRSKSDRKNIENDYIALMNLDFSWSWPKVLVVKKLWNAGYHIAEIAEEVDRIIDEVALLIMDLARKKKIQERPGGVFGIGEVKSQKRNRRSA